MRKLLTETLKLRDEMRATQPRVSTDLRTSPLSDTHRPRIIPMNTASRIRLLVLIASFMVQMVSAAAAESQENAQKRVMLWLEAGPAWQSYNDVQIPASTGTRFSISDFGKGPFAAWRVYAGYQLSDKSGLRLLLAPLSVTVTGTPSSALSYQNTTFAAGVPTDALYKFNSYRLTYQYKFHESDTLALRIGFTAKIRDAEIRLTQGALTAARTDLGFVPLLNFVLDWRFNPGWALVLDADALAAPQGRAEDVALQLGRDLTPDLQLRAGYRMVEGGSSGGGSVYSFAWFHYATLGVLYRL